MKKVKKIILLLLIFCLIFVFQCPYSFGIKNTSNKYSNIMKDIYDKDNGFGDVLISEIAMLGSHDALTDEINYLSKPDTTRQENKHNNFAANPFIYYLLKGFAVRLAKAQTLNVYEQLNAGSRFLDVRITENEGIFYNAHGLISNKLEDNLKLILKFLDENPGEFIIFSILDYYQEESSWDDLCDYINSIKINDKSLFDYVNYNLINEDFSSLTYNDVTNDSNSSGVIFLARNYDGDKYEDYFSLNPFVINKGCGQANYKKIDDDIYDHAESASEYDSSYLKINQTQITPNKEGILSVLFNWSLINISDLHNDNVIRDKKYEDWFKYMPIYLSDNVTSNKNGFNSTINEYIIKYNIDKARLVK